MTDSKRRPRVVRPSGASVFAGVLILIAVVWWLFADTAVERGVESTGEDLVGARVELASADVRPTEGSVRLIGLAVANPDAPMKNLFEADEIVTDLRMGPLLQKKVVVERLVVSGVRFGTDRTTSGALDDPDPEAGALWRQVNGWVDAVQIPSLSLDNLGGVVRADAISSDSLRTVAFARTVVGRADSLGDAWSTELTTLDPRPRIDSVAAVASRLEEFRLSPLNAIQVPGLIRDGRAAIERVTSLQEEIGTLDDTVRDGIASLELRPEVIEGLRDEDLRYARRLLRIPSLDALTISPSLFGPTALSWLKPVLYWAQAAERFLPPGLDPRRRPGPSRSRAEGTTFDFREGATYPSFLIEQGDLGVEIGGTGAAAGAYTARLSGVTSSPSLLGEPMTLTLGREGGAVGPAALTVRAVLDHTAATVRDTVALAMSGVSLPGVDLEAFGGRLDPGLGSVHFELSRDGDRIDARMSWTSDAVSWTSTPGQPATEAGRDALPGSPEWAQALIWRTLTGVESLRLEMGIGGTLDNPALTVESNLGEAVANSLRTELGREIEAAEAEIRTELDARIDPVVGTATARVEELRSSVVDRVAAQRAEVDDLRARLEARIQELIGDR